MKSLTNRLCRVGSLLNLRNEDKNEERRRPSSTLPLAGSAALANATAERERRKESEVRIKKNIKGEEGRGEEEFHLLPVLVWF